MSYVERFSLLILEPGEIYFCDYSTYYTPPRKDNLEGWERKWSSEELKGRLKICSKSVVFEPFEKEVPVIKFSLRNCTNIQQKLYDCKKSTIGSEVQDSIEVVSDATIEMLENNLIRPYKFRRKKYMHCFRLLLTKADDALPLLLQLHRASTLPPNDQNVMIQAIVRSLLRRKEFDLSYLKDSTEKVLLEVQASTVNPLVTNPGKILISSSAFYFQPLNNLQQSPVQRVPFKDITGVTERRYLLRHVGLEIFCKGKMSNSEQHLYLLFKEPEDRDAVYRCLIDEVKVKLTTPKLQEVTYKWQTGAISNFEYLSFLNSRADRSRNDLTQYPVFPWVIADYHSETLDLTDPSSFRDLTKPVGALNEKRLSALKERCEQMPEPKFLYGSHYSTPGFVVYFLLRKFPQCALCLQNGKFDHPDRMFNSIADTYYNVTTNPSDFKELIPEFYDPTTKGDFLANRKSIPFGVRQNGRLVWDVTLPPWAPSTRDVVDVFREALECDHVSSSLNRWIDLIFGYQQQGEEALKADNLFFHMCYEGSVNLTSITDLSEKFATEIQIMEFGQIPKQLFKAPHPRRDVRYALYNSAPRADSTEEDGDAPPRVIRAIATPGEPGLYQLFRHLGSLTQLRRAKLHKKEVTHVAFTSDGGSVVSLGKEGALHVVSLNSFEQVGYASASRMAVSACVQLPGCNELLVSCWDNYLYRYHLRLYQQKDSLQAHSDAITCMDANEEVLLTGSWDCLVKVWRWKVPPAGPDGLWSPWRLYMNDLLVQMDHDGPVNCLQLHPEGGSFASGSTDGVLTSWYLHKEKTLFKLQCHEGAINELKWSPDGGRILTCGSDGKIAVVSRDSGALILTFSFNLSLFSAFWDGRLVFLGSQSGDIFVHDVAEEKTLATIKAHSGAVTALCPSADGSAFVSGGEDRTVVLWGPRCGPSS